MIQILFIAETSAAFGLLFFLCIGEDMIFERYGKFIEGKYWFKPLGGCQTCTMVWMGVLTALMFKFLFPVFIGVSIVSNSVLIFRKIV